MHLTTLISLWAFSGCSTPESTPPQLKLIGPQTVHTSSPSVVSMPEVHNTKGDEERVKWRVADTEIAEVRNNQLHSKSVGNTAIIGTTRTDEVRFQLIVHAPPVLQFDSPPSKISRGTNLALMLRVTQSDASAPSSPIQWSSTAPTILSVDSTGTIQAEKPGWAYITAKAGPSVASVEIQVTP